MSAEATVPPTTVDQKQHATFFRQSGWLMMANIIGGLMTLGVHFLAKVVPENQYSIFGTLLMVTACVPILPLQMVFAQQTANALATDRRRQLAGMIQLGTLLTFGVWLAVNLGVLAFQGRILDRWQLGQPVVLWVTMAAVLANLWMPLFCGVLQGRQDFFWLGWATIANGAMRLAVAAAFVFLVSRSATGMMLGTFMGIAAWAGVAMWRTRDLSCVRSEPFDWRSFLGQVVPLMLGFGACQVLFTSDSIFVKAYFSGKEMAPYVAAGTLSRGLLWLVLPMALVMFPKIVQSHAKSGKTNLLPVVLLGTAILAICGGAALCLVGPWVVRLVYEPGYVAATTALLPWYAGAMVPLALANVLANDLLARGRFRVVPLMVVLTVAYGITLPYLLNHYHGHAGLKAVLQALGGYNLLLLLVCGLFAWVDTREVRVETGS